MKADTTRAIHKVNQQLRDMIRKLPRQQALLIVSVAGIALIGSYLLSASKASGPVVATEPENGTLSSGAVKTTDTQASGGAAVTFKAAPTPPPPAPTPPPPAPTPPPPPPTNPLQVPSGTAAELASRILANANISFQTASERTWFTEITRDGTMANDCGGRVAISPKLLGVLLVAAAKYKVVVGVLSEGHGCDTGFHPKGMAVDLNGVNPAPGGPTGTGTGNILHWDTMTAAQMTFAKGFYGYVGQILSANGGGGMGQVQCMVSPPKSAGVVYFTDTCNHLHVDVGKR